MKLLVETPQNDEKQQRMNRFNLYIFDIFAVVFRRFAVFLPTISLAGES